MSSRGRKHVSHATICYCLISVEGHRHLICEKLQIKSLLENRVHRDMQQIRRQLIFDDVLHSASLELTCCLTSSCFALRGLCPEEIKSTESSRETEARTCRV